MLDRRDILEIASTNLACSLESTMNKTIHVAAERSEANNKNRELTAALLELTDRIKEGKDAAMAQPELSVQLHNARQEAETAKDQWKIMKGVVSAVIAGSGVDWARDDSLLELVLDADEDA